MADTLSGQDIARLYGGGGSSAGADLSSGEAIADAYRAAPAPAAEPTTEAPARTPRPYESLHALVAPSPGYIASGILPLQTKETYPGSGQGDPSQGWKLGWGLLGSLFDLGVSAAEGPATGTVTPDVTMALLGSKAPSPMHGARQILGREAIDTTPLPAPAMNEAERGMPTPPPRISPIEARIAEIRAANAAMPPPEPPPAVMSEDFQAAPSVAAPPVGPAFIPPGAKIPVLPRILELLRADEATAATRPAELPPGAAQPPNPLQQPGPRVVPGAARPSLLDPNAAPAMPAEAAAGPQSVGAMASREGTPADVLSAQTPGQRIAALEKSVTQTAEDRAGPQMRDDTAYVEGIPPRTLAGRDFSKSVNQLDEKVASAKDQAFRDKVDKVNRDRNEGMVDVLRKDAGDAVSLEKAYEARDAVGPDKLGVFKTEQPVDASGLAGTIQNLLDGPEGKQAAVRSTLTSVLKELYDKDGNLETLPSRIYGARKNLTDLLKKGAKGVGQEADDVRASKHHLNGLLPVFDETISSGAPRFKSEYLKQWSELSEPIDRMEFLQQYQTGSKKLTGPDGYLQPNKVQKMLDDILQAHKASGVNGAKRLTAAEIQNVINVRNEQAAISLQRRLEGVRGSDTFQQMNRPGVFSRGPVGGLAREALLAAPTLGVGNLLYHYGIKPGMEIKRANRLARLEAARKEELLAPPNLLNPP